MNIITVEGGKKEQRQIVEDVVSYMIQRQMPRMRTLDIHVTLKKGVLDPQGKAIGTVLETMGFCGISDVRQGKYIEVKINESSHAAAKNKADEMCKKLLANTVIENYEIKIED